MDTGYVQLLDAAARARVLEAAASACGPGAFVAGAYLDDRPGDRVRPRRPRRALDAVAERGGTPVVFPSHGLNGGRRGRLGGRARGDGPALRPVHRLRARHDVRAPRPHLLARRLRGAARGRRLHRGQALVAVPAVRVGPPGRARPRPARLPRAHRQRPGHRHGLLRLRLPARAVGVRARRLRRARPPLGGGRPGVPRAQRPAAVPRVLRVPRPRSRLPPRRRHRAARPGLDHLRRAPRPVRSAGPTRRPSGRSSPTSSSACRPRRRDAGIVQVKRLRTFADLQARLAELGIAGDIGADERVDPGGALAEPYAVQRRVCGRAAGRQPLRRAADGGVGRHRRRPAHRPRAAPVAAVRRERRQARLGRRGGGGPGRTAGPTPTSSSSTTPPTGALAALREELVDAHRHACGATDDLVVGLQLTHSGRWARPSGHARAGRGVPPPDPRPQVPPTPPGPHRRRARRPGRRLRHRRRAGARGRASTSSTSSTATATCCTSCSRRSNGPGATAATSTGAPRSCGRWSPASARPSPTSPSACASRRSTWRRSSPTATASASPSTRPRTRRSPSAATAPGRASTSTEAHRFLDLCGTLGIGLRVRHRGQPLLQPAHPAAGLLPPVRRLRPARGPAGRRGQACWPPPPS